MKKAKELRIPKLKKNATETEIIRWATKHDPLKRTGAGIAEIVKDHSDLDELLQEALFQENTTQLNIRIPPAMKAMLTKLARERTTDASTLGRIWLAERIRKETGSR